MSDNSKRSGPQAGFTLIELMMVIVLMAILAAIVIFAVQTLGGETARASCKSDYKIVENAVGAYSAQVGHYPKVGDAAASYPGGDPILGGLTDSMNGLQALYSTQTAQVSGATVGPWLKDIPTNGHHYSIELSTDGKGQITVDDAAGNNQSNCAAVQ